MSANDSKTSARKQEAFRPYEASSSRKFPQSVASGERAKSSVYKSRKKKKSKKEKKRSKGSKSGFFGEKMLSMEDLSKRMMYGRGFFPPMLPFMNPYGGGEGFYNGEAPFMPGAPG